MADIRKEYSCARLDESSVAPEPVAQFRTWFAEALKANLPEPNAMTLSTCTPDGRPSGRIVLLKGIEDDGFVFFTNYESRKGHELAANPWAALTMHWIELERQVRIEGHAERLPAEASHAYFRSRPRDSQLGAWTSPQSRVIANRADLELWLQEKELVFSGEGELPLPPFWGGYIIKPHSVEFWQGRPSRLHDRIRFRKPEPPRVDWVLERLAP